MATNGEANNADEGRPPGIDPPDRESFLSTFTGFEVSSIDSPFPENRITSVLSLPALTSEQTELITKNNNKHEHQYQMVKRESSSNSGIDPDGIDSASLSSSDFSSNRSQNSRRSRRSLEPPDSLSRIVVETASSESSYQVIKELKQEEAKQDLAFDQVIGEIRGGDELVSNISADERSHYERRFERMESKFQEAIESISKSAEIKKETIVKQESIDVKHEDWYDKISDSICDKLNLLSYKSYSDIFKDVNEFAKIPGVSMPATKQYAEKQIESRHALEVLAKEAEMKRSPDPTKVEKPVINEFMQTNMDFEAQLEEAKSDAEFSRIKTRHQMWMQKRVAEANIESAGMDTRSKGRSMEKNYEKDGASKFKMEDFKNSIRDKIDEDTAGRWRERMIQTLGYYPWSIKDSNIYDMPIPSADDVDLSKH